MQNVNVDMNETTQKPKPSNVLGEFSKYSKLATFTDGRNLHSLAHKSNEGDLSDDTALVTCRNLLKSLQKISYSLNAATTYPIMDQRVMTLYKESSQHEYTIHKVSTNLPAFSIPR
jgi:hypothetical protein